MTNLLRVIIYNTARKVSVFRFSVPALRLTRKAPNTDTFYVVQASKKNHYGQNHVTLGSKKTAKLRPILTLINLHTKTIEDCIKDL